MKWFTACRCLLSKRGEVIVIITLSKQKTLRGLACKVPSIPLSASQIACQKRVLSKQLATANFIICFFTSLCGGAQGRYLGGERIWLAGVVCRHSQNTQHSNHSLSRVCQQNCRPVFVSVSVGYVFMCVRMYMCPGAARQSSHHTNCVICSALERHMEAGQ